jgi:hypothetical protein
VRPNCGFVLLFLFSGDLQRDASWVFVETEIGRNMRQWLCERRLFFSGFLSGLAVTPNGESCQQQLVVIKCRVGFNSRRQSISVHCASSWQRSAPAAFPIPSASPSARRRIIALKQSGPRDTIDFPNLLCGKVDDSD